MHMYLLVCDQTAQHIWYSNLVMYLSGSICGGEQLVITHTVNILYHFYVSLLQNILQATITVSCSSQFILVC